MSTDLFLQLIATALTSAGLTELGIIVLFGANAALPHASARDKRLERGEFVLMDVDGSLLGYQSDLTRTMLPDVASSCGRRVVGGERRWPSERSEKVWRTVLRAQHAALESLEREQGVVIKAKDVDRAARSVIEAEGWGQYFSHRLGHGGSHSVRPSLTLLMDVCRRNWIASARTPLPQRGERRTSEGRGDVLQRAGNLHRAVSRRRPRWNRRPTRRHGPSHRDGVGAVDGKRPREGSVESVVFDECTRSHGQG